MNMENVMPTIVTCPKCGAKNRVDGRVETMQAVCGECGALLANGGAPTGGKPLEITDVTFAQHVLSAQVPVLVDCWAPWCGPCRMLAPTLDQLAAEANGRYVVAKLNVDDNLQTAAKFGIDAIPALLIFKQGQLVEKLVGLQPKQAIVKRLEAVA